MCMCVLYDELLETLLTDDISEESIFCLYNIINLWVMNKKLVLNPNKTEQLYKSGNILTIKIKLKIKLGYILN